jgi:putative transposase
MQLTYQFRLRDKHRTELDRQARAVNFVWNFCNETQRYAVHSSRKWLSGYDLMKLTAGTSGDLDLHGHTIQKACAQYDKSRRQHKKPWLRFRGKKSLGWVPFNTGTVTFDGAAFVFRGVRYEPMHLRALGPGVKIGAGSFSADSRGRWYINVPAEVPCAATAPGGEVGLDLGLKSLAATSDGEAIEAPRFYRKHEAALATLQRARKSKRVTAIHAKIQNRRKDFLHKASAKIARKNGLIVVGDVSPTKIAKTPFAKSSLDAGWADFKKMLSYKSIRNGGTFLEVAEAYTSQTCSTCGALPESRPKGIAGLGIREWTCSDCGAVHDRDVNAARNILRLGQQTLVGGTHAAA